MLGRVRVTKPGHAERSIPRRELTDAIASGWAPVWDQSLDSLATQVAALQEAVVDLAEAQERPRVDTPAEPVTPKPGSARP